jgi:hypothetical protein
VLHLQGLGWYVNSIRMDEQGDVAHGFYIERSGKPTKMVRVLQVRDVMPCWACAGCVATCCADV